MEKEKKIPRQQHHQRIKLSTKEISELVVEAFITIILLLMLNMALYYIVGIITQIQPFESAVYNIKKYLVDYFGSDSLYSWGKFGILFMALLDCLILIWRLRRRLRQMQLNHILDELHYIAAGHFDHRIPFSLKGELGEVTRSINALVDGTNAAINEERRIEQSKDELITNVSHDIRTPLTSIIGYLGLIENDHYHNEDERNHYTHTAYLKAKQMKTLVDDLFEYTKVRQPSAPLNYNQFDLYQLLEQLAADFELEATNQQMEIRVDTNAIPFPMEADTEKLVRVFNNLVSNALKYGNDGNSIVLHAEKKEQEAVIKVMNNGKPIPRFALDQLFDRFYRVEESRSQETGGTGLGLAIAQSIVSLHGGYIYATSDNGWTAFIIHLPLKKPKSQL